MRRCRCRTRICATVSLYVFRSRRQGIDARDAYGHSLVDGEGKGSSSKMQVVPFALPQGTALKGSHTICGSRCAEDESNELGPRLLQGWVRAEPTLCSDARRKAHQRRLL